MWGTEVQELASTVMRPLSSATPAASSPRSESQGRRPVAISTPPQAKDSPFPSRAVSAPGSPSTATTVCSKSTSMPCSRMPIQHGIGQLGIKTAQQARTTHHLGDRNTKAPQDAGELAGNETCAHHHHG